MKFFAYLKNGFLLMCFPGEHYLHTYTCSTVEPLYCGHHWDSLNCPDLRGALHVVLCTIVAFGTRGVRGVLISECPVLLYNSINHYSILVGVILFTH